MKQEIYQFDEKYHIIERTWRAFWKAYECYLLEYPEEAARYALLDRSSVLTALERLSYVLLHEQEQEIITVRIQMRSREKNASYLGYYDCIFDLTGKMSDDFFVIE